eukprot:TRINITY_DN1634_c1_g1_i2.p1 TRINITY_DN1634_c1_g1~~TRINITY_DN1634_c1_g1_i2.p1  ORF type:complete len:115 (+),score=11.40 TRINITY_DN1634_c1_g1_i2:269-613(+)
MLCCLLSPWCGVPRPRPVTSLSLSLSHAGGSNIFEITQDSSGRYQQHPLFSSGSAYFLGMAIVNGYLYTAYQAGGKNMIGAAQLTSGSLPVVKPVGTLIYIYIDTWTHTQYSSL